MNTFLVSIIVLGVFLVSDLSEGAEWILISKGPSSGADVFVDQESIVRISDAVVRVRIKYRYSKPRRFDSHYIKELIAFNEYYCGEMKYKILGSEGHFTDGTHETDPSERQGYILPDDAVYGYLCR